MLLQRLSFIILMTISLLAGFSTFVGNAKAQFFWEKIEAEQRKREAAERAPPSRTQKQTKQREVQQQPEIKPRGLFNNVEFEPLSATREGEGLERAQPKRGSRASRKTDLIDAQKQNMAPGVPQAAYREGDIKPAGGGFFNWLFGAPKDEAPDPVQQGGQGAPVKVFVDPDAAAKQNSGPKMVCVRTCDGAFMPISTGRQGSSERNYELCEAQCPGSETKVFRMLDELIENAVSQDGERYMSLPNALKFRNSFDKTCSCRPQGKSWAEFAAGMEDPTIRKGDSVLTTEQARRMAIAPALRNASLRESVNDYEVKAKVSEPVEVAPQQSPVRVITIAPPVHVPLKVQGHDSEVLQPTNGLNPVERLLLERNIKRNVPVKNGLIEGNDKRG